MTLYDDLGVTHDASPAEIKRAYRSKAKRAHPDRGGSEEEFHKISRAHLVLSNPGRRARYDETGAADDVSIDSDMQKVLDILARLFENALQALVQRQLDAGSFDMLHNMRTDLTNNIAEAKRNRGDGETMVRRMEKITGRFQTSSKPDKIGLLVAARLIEVKRNIDKANDNLRLLEMASNMMKGYSYQLDIPNLRPGTMTYHAFRPLGARW